MSDDDPHQRDREMAKEKRAPGEQSGEDDEGAEAEQAREEEPEDETRVEAVPGWKTTPFGSRLTPWKMHDSRWGIPNQTGRK